MVNTEKTQTTGETASTPWGREYLLESSRNQISRASEYYRDTEHDFAKTFSGVWDEYVTLEQAEVEYAQKTSPTREEIDQHSIGQARSRSLLEKYRTGVERFEKYATQDWQTLANATDDAIRQDAFPNPHPVFISFGQQTLPDTAILYQKVGVSADATNLTPEKSIEAASGIFYRERFDMLSDAISSASSEDKASDLETLRNTDKIVDEYFHLYKYTEADLGGMIGAANYDTERRNAHQSMVHQLNVINDLARKYDTTPFTFRNFMENPKGKYHGAFLAAINDRSAFDRKAVVGYFLKSSVALREEERRNESQDENITAKFHKVTHPEDPRLGYELMNE